MTKQRPQKTPDSDQKNPFLPAQTPGFGSAKNLQTRQIISMNRQQILLSDG
jgi:hypothetical protein